jgi:DNA ligase-1
MKQILEIFNQLTATTSRTEKENILKNNKDNELFKTILEFVYNPYIVTGLSSKKLNKKVKLPSCLGMQDIIDLMGYLKSNNTGRDFDIGQVQSFINSRHESTRELYRQIVTKDLKVGITATTINKIYGEGFIPTFSVMLAEKYFDYEDKITGEFIVTKKLDGNRNVAYNEEDAKVTMFTRQGQVNEGFIEVENDIDKYLPEGFVYDGEFIALNNNDLNSADLYRETTSVVRKDGVKKNVVFHIFDMIPITDFKKGYCAIPCSVRKEMLHKCFENIPANAWITEVPVLYKGTDKTKVIELLNQMIAEGQEGVMVNIADAGYSCKRTRDILKVKKFLDADVRVVNILEGEGENKGRLGAITIQFIHNDAIYECNCGTGFSQEERILYWNRPELIMNNIVTIGYFEVSSNKKGGFGLRFPSWKSIIRLDKTEISMY